MREPTRDVDPVTQRVLTTAGLGPLLAEAEAVWRSRAAGHVGADSGRSGRDPLARTGRPGWRPFEDAFPTFYQFTNRPPR